MFEQFDIEKTFIMAIVLGIISCVLLFLDSKHNKYNNDMQSYVKVFMLTALISYVSSNLTNGGVANTDLQVFTGQPDF